jgi:hypothetical protein
MINRLSLRSKLIRLTKVLDPEVGISSGIDLLAWLDSLLSHVYYSSRRLAG